MHVFNLGLAILKYYAIFSHFAQGIYFEKKKVSAFNNPHSLAYFLRDIIMMI